MALVAKYTSLYSDLLPTFNTGYQYSVNETVSNGIYTVEIHSDNDFSSIVFKSKKDLLTVDYLKITNKVTTFSVSNYGMFEGCSNLTYVNTEGWDSSEVTDVRYMFYNCTGLIKMDFSGLNFSKVTNAQQLFYNCNSLTEVNLNGLDLRNIQTTSSMFAYCSNLKTVYMKNSDYISVNKIIEALPSRSEGDMGILNLADIDDMSQINKASANIKYWVISADRITVNNINIGEVSISDLYIGSVGVKQIYLGDILIYENVEVVNDKVLLFNEAIGTLFLLGDGLLQYDEKNLSLTVSDEMEIVYDKEDLNLTIGGEE